MGTVTQDSAILLLNREDKDAELMTSLLEKVGLRVLSSGNAADALEAVSAEGQSARLLVVDEAASAASIPEFWDRVRAVNPQLRVLLVSDRDQVEPSRNSLSQPKLTAFLKKPFRRAKFLGSVLHLIDEPLVRTA